MISFNSKCYQDAIRDMDGKELFGGRIRCEISRGGRGGHSGRGGGGFDIFLSIRTECSFNLCFLPLLVVALAPPLAVGLNALLASHSSSLLLLSVPLLPNSCSHYSRTYYCSAP
jgi:hypothetical protein